MSKKSIEKAYFVLFNPYFGSLTQEQTFKNGRFRIRFCSQLWWTLWITRLKSHFSPKIAPVKLWITFCHHPCHFYCFRKLTPLFVHFPQAPEKADSSAFFHWLIRSRWFLSLWYHSGRLLASRPRPATGKRLPSKPSPASISRSGRSDAPYRLRSALRKTSRRCDKAGINRNRFIRRRPIIKHAVVYYRVLLKAFCPWRVATCLACQTFTQHH